MRIGISTPVFDLDGARLIRVTPQTGPAMFRGARRVSSTATLDGGALLYDTGYAVADRTATIEAAEHDVRGTADWFAMLVKTYNLIKVVTDEGVFLAAPSKWSMKNDTPTLELLLTEQLA